MVEASILETDEAMATSPALRESTVTLSGSILQSEDEIGKIILPINIYIFIRCYLSWLGNVLFFRTLETGLQHD